MPRGFSGEVLKDREVTLRTLLHPRPALKVALSYVVGVLVGWYVSLPALLVFASILFLGVAAIVVSRSSSQFWKCFLPLFLLIGVTCAGAFKITLDKRVFPASHVVHFVNDRDSVVVRGSVVSQPTSPGGRVRFLLRAERIYRRGSVFSTDGDVLVFLSSRAVESDTMREISYGDRLILVGRLQSPSTARNPGDFDYRRYLEVNNIYATMYISKGEGIQRESAGRGGWLQRSVVVPPRRRFELLVDNAIGGDEAEFLKGLIIGDRSGISTEIKSSFVNAGVMHVLAVSGLHVGIVAGIFFVVLGLLRLPHLWKVIGTIIGLAWYAALTGLAPPVVRASIMATVVLIGSLLERRVDSYNSLAVAALAILLVDAKQLFHPGFQLSFAAVFALIYTYPKWIRLNSMLPPALKENVFVKGLLSLLVLSMAAQLGTLPFNVLYFGKISLVALAANLVVIPLVGILVPLGFLTLICSLISPWLAGIYAEVAQLILAGMIKLVNLVGNLRWSAVEIPPLGAASMVCFYGIFLSAVHWNHRFVRRVAVFVVSLSLTALIWTTDVGVLNPRVLRITVLDVGQGDTIFLEFPDGKTMLIDAGPRTMHSNAGERMIIPFLRKRGISSIDVVLITHPHSDHIGGLEPVLQEFSVRRVVDTGHEVGSNVYKRFMAFVEAENIPLQRVQAGDTLGGFKGIRLYVLHPRVDRGHPANGLQVKNLNDVSVVLKLVYGETSFLFTGDVERNGERELQQNFGTFLDADALKIGHHGSSTSSSLPFLQEVTPRIGIISVGKFNKFSHPSEEVLARLHELQIEVHRTDEQGAVVLESDAKRISIVDWR
ncbi:MAG: DNA internalization-related competence protein ComEC/Rec2 [Bacteroidota bacterium]